MCCDILEGHDNQAKLVLDIIFEASRCSSSTNPEDAVYSLMPLASDASNKTQYPQCSDAVPVIAVFIHATPRIVNYTDSLDTELSLLRRCGLRLDDSSMSFSANRSARDPCIPPSWLPVFDINFFRKFGSGCSAQPLFSFSLIKLWAVGKPYSTPGDSKADVVIEVW